MNQQLAYPPNFARGISYFNYRDQPLFNRLLHQNQSHVIQRRSDFQRIEFDLNTSIQGRQANFIQNQIRTPILVIGLGVFGLSVLIEFKNKVKDCFGGTIPEEFQFLWGRSRA